jgi:integrase
MGRPRLKRSKADEGTKGIKPTDRFVVEWVDPSKTRCREKIAGQGKTAKKLADDRCRQLNAEMTLGTYNRKDDKSWAQFREQFTKKVLAGMEVSSREVVEVSLAHFERLCKPKLMASIDTETIDDFIARRRTERGKKPGSTVSKASVNKDLRNLRATLRKAARWGYIKQAPEFSFLKEDDKLIRFVSPEHFEAIYATCHAATMPEAQGYSAADWWRALLVTAFMTGWRINELMTLLWEDVDLDGGKAMLRADNTKGGRYEELPLSPIVVEHLRKLPSFKAEVFAWDGWSAEKRTKTLWDAFHDIQAAAGIHLVCHGKHDHTDACHFYAFHDLRRAFGTLNAESLTADALQRLMRHKSYSTTQRYINMAGQLNRAVEKLYVPALPQAARA